MKPSTKKWIEAGSILQKDPSAKVLCPECGVGTLMVKDEPIGDVGQTEKRIERYLICNNCGEWNVISMVLPNAEPSSE